MSKLKTSNISKFKNSNISKLKNQVFVFGIIQNTSSHTQLPAIPP
jgi:hypothetical protein